MTETTTDTLTRHLHSALSDADDPDVRFHLRHALQYLDADEPVSIDDR